MLSVNFHFIDITYVFIYVFKRAKTTKKSENTQKKKKSNKKQKKKKGASVGMADVATIIFDLKKQKKKKKPAMQMHGWGCCHLPHQWIN